MVNNDMTVVRWTI